MTNLDGVLKSTVTADKGPCSEGYGTDGESCTIKKAGRQRTDAFDLWCWRRLARVPRTEKRSNQSILREINPDYSLEGLMLKFKFQCFHHLM